MTAGPPTADLFVRSIAPVGARARPAATVERLEALVEAGILDDYTVSVWGKEVECSSDVTRRTKDDLVLGRVPEFRSWVAERGADLDAFDRREVSTATGETHTLLTLPVVTLAEYVGGDLVRVAPCTVDGDALTVEDRVEALEERGGSSRPREDERTAEGRRSVRTHGHDTARL